MKLKEVVRKIIPKYKYTWVIGTTEDGRKVLRGGYLAKKMDKRDWELFKEYGIDRNWRWELRNEWEKLGITNIKDIELYARTPKEFRDEIKKMGVEI